VIPQVTAAGPSSTTPKLTPRAKRPLVAGTPAGGLDEDLAVGGRAVRVAASSTWAVFPAGVGSAGGALSGPPCRFNRG